VRKLTLLLLCGFLSLTVSTAGEPQEKGVVRFASLEWPPYVGENLPGQGAAAVAARAAFVAMGYKLEIDFFPWARTLLLARRPGLYDGYFPEYHAETIEEFFIFSHPLGDSPLGFVERKDNPVPWTDLEDLQGIVIGTVQGYVNTDDFDRFAEEGTLIVESAGADIYNVRMVAAGRLPLAVIDRHVLSWLLDTDESLKVNRDQVQFNSTLLGVRELFLCFRKPKKADFWRISLMKG
jgi:polar amino acid transport system substrate-binding protein